MNEELIVINRDILLKGMFSLYFDTEELDESELNELAQRKKQIQIGLIKTDKDYHDKEEGHKNKLRELDSKYGLNVQPNEEESLHTKIEQYRTYKVLYDEKFDYIIKYHGLNTTKKTYDAIDYFYLISKI